jgi:hypothetical protein
MLVLLGRLVFDFLSDEEHTKLRELATEFSPLPYAHKRC